MLATAFDPSARELREKLHAFIVSRVRSREVADDLTQESLLKATRAIVKTPVENPQGWLFQIARNTVADHFRRSRDQVEWQEDTHGGTTSENALTREETALREQLADYVRHVVQHLRPSYREALHMTEYEGLSQPELARRLGISLTCAKSRVQRARAEVKREIERCCRVAADVYGQITECVPHQPAGCAC